MFKKLTPKADSLCMKIIRIMAASLRDRDQRVGDIHESEMADFLSDAKHCLPASVLLLNVDGMSLYARGKIKDVTAAVWFFDGWRTGRASLDDVREDE